MLRKLNMRRNRKASDVARSKIQSGRNITHSTDPCNNMQEEIILRQMVDAAIHMHNKGVFHRDIKLQNVLVELESGAPRVQIIDFGCGTFSLEKFLLWYRAYVPSEWCDYLSYWARPTTVWQLGAT